MIPEEREDQPLGGGRAPARGPVAVARALSPIASAILLALIAVLLGIVVRQGERPSSPKPGKCNFNIPITPQPPFAPHSPVLLSNGLVWLGVGTGMQPNTDVLLVDGKIAQIGTKINPPPGAVVIDLNGAVVTPGVVDLHSHAGVYSWPEDINALSDGNEMTNPTFPQVRAIDAFDPQDFAIPWIRQGGTTAAQVMPGSGNVMGGEAVHVKYRISTTVQDLLLLGGPPAEKMATGENPKHVYGPMGQTPMTRMGTAWLMREKFEQAQQLIQQQELWCASGAEGPMPSDLSLEPLVEILRGQRTLNIHSYEVVDLETCIRISQEFGFKIGAFHHALEAWMIPDIIKANNITVATFADLWGFKWEAYDASVWAPQILSDAGVKTCLKSDHAVTDSHYLMWMAAKATHYNMKPDYALASVTSVPAAVIGYENRIGSLRVGLDADVVVWNRHPLLLGAVPNYVFIEGQTVYTNPQPTWGSTTLPVVTSTLSVAGGSAPVPDSSVTLASYSIQGTPLVVFISYTLQLGATVWDMNSSNPQTNVNIVVQNGVVTCVGPAASCPVGTTNVFSVTGAGTAPTVTPGFIESDTILGQSDIDQEPITQDGELGVDGDYLYAADGIAIQTKHVTAALKGGVTVSINAPMGTGVIGGYGVAWKTSGTTLLDAMVQEVVGMHVSIGQQAKSGGPYSSVSGQISTLRTRFQAAQAEIAANAPPSAFSRLLLGEIPLVAHVGQADYIASLLRLQAAFNFTMIIVGGNEAWVVANQLAAANVPVIVSPPLCGPQEFYSIARCTNNNAATLATAGVKVAISTGNYELSRHIRWDAGWQVEYGLTYVQALAAITSNVADAFGLTSTGLGRILPNKPANFVLWDADPLTMASHPLVVAAGSNLQILPRQQ